MANAVFAQTPPWQLTETTTGAHDPSIVRDNRGIYTLMTTNNLLEIRQSTNMVNWTSRDRIFNSLPSWMTSIYSTIENIWAPHICFRNGRYWVYYCGSSFGSNNSVIGVASTPTLDYQASNYAWTDHGEVFRSTTINNYNAIDPELLVDKNGRVWMSFGSFWQGLRMIEIDPSTGKRLASNTTIYNIASRNGGAIEGPSTIEHNGYYYLFSSWDACCAGTSSTYRTMVCRSSNPNSGFVDKNGTALTSNASTELLKQYGRYYGPGGGSAFRDGRRDYYVLHYYNANQNGAPTLQIREIVWTADNWPILAQPFLGRRLSYEAEHAILTSSTISTSSNASNKEYVSGISASGSKVLFYINAFAAGEYTVRVHHSSLSANSSHLVKINGGSAIEVSYPTATTAGQFPIGQSVSFKAILKEGGNTIEFGKGTNTVEIDKIDLMRSATGKLEGGAMDNGVGVTYVPTNNNASLTANSWMLFENVDFANGGLKTISLGLQNAGGAQFRINLDAHTGSTNATFTTSASNKINTLTLPSNLQTVTGLHDVYVTLVSGNVELDYVQFGAEDAVVTDCNGVDNGTATTDNCSRCVGGTTGKTACTAVAEAETEACSFEGAVEATNIGFKGNGYVNGTNAQGSVITFGINATNAGNATVSFRYASATDRSAQVNLNGAILPNSFNFPSTGDFVTWKTVEITLSLLKGNNLIKLSALAAEGLANLDQIGYVSTGLSKGSCLSTNLPEEVNANTAYTYPNPFTQELHLIAEGSFEYEIHSLTGVLLENGNGETLLSVGQALQAGMYLVKIRQNGSTQQLKVAKH